MSLTRVQRDAMVRAQQGNWELADALEVSRRQPYRGIPCAGGIRQGGRLQLLAFGELRCYCDMDDTCECFEGVLSNLEVMTDLNGREVWRDAGGGDPPPYRIDITPGDANTVLHAYQAEIDNPIQQPLILEAA